ncbi:MAG: hypothetical protein ACR2P1_03375 [Pseudomonadales bacterium]
MKRIFVALALLLAVGCDDQKIIIIKDGQFGQLGLLVNRGAIVHYLGLDVLGADRLQSYTNMVNNTDGEKVVVDIGRSDENAQNSLEQFNTDYDNFVKSLPVTGVYEGREIICIQRSVTYAPPASCGRIVQAVGTSAPVSALWDELFPPAS